MDHLAERHTPNECTGYTDFSIRCKICRRPSYHSFAFSLILYFPSTPLYSMWYNYLMPTLNRKAWSSDEEDELLNAIAEYGAQNWSEIARYVANRSAYQCFVHYQTTLGENQAQKNVPWTDNEDQRLRDYVEKYRIGNIIPWTKITGMMPNRNRIQVYNR